MGTTVKLKTSNLPENVRLLLSALGEVLAW